MITALTVNYNTPEYLERLLKSFRQFYDIPYLVVDGSDNYNYEKIKDFPQRFNIELHHFPYNIHHGPGITYGINRIKTEQILLCDSDIIILNRGLLENMISELRPNSYGIGDIQKESYPVTKIVGNKRAGKYARKTIREITIINNVLVDYLHPVFALVNKDIVLKHPLPTVGYGAPLLPAMIDISNKKENILQISQWLTDDLHLHKGRYIQHNHNHNGMGTIKATGGYHYERIKRIGLPTIMTADNKEKNSPAIGIVITTFKRPDGKTPDYLNRTLASIKSQTFQDYRVYVIGDAYEDDNELKSIVLQYPNTVCYNLNKSVERDRYAFGDERLWSAAGVNAANIGIDYALKDGIKYICHLAHDDYWESNHLEVVNRVITEKQPLFICTLSTYGGTGAFPRKPITNKIQPFLPVPAGLIASSVCIKYSDTKLRVKDCFYEDNIIYPSDADLWRRMASEIKINNLGSYIVTTITCHHDEEGYVMKIK